MNELTRRRAPDTADCWLIFFGDVQVGTIGRRAGVPATAEQWGWRCGFVPPAHRGLHAEGTAEDFPDARRQFEAAWRNLRPSCADDDFAEYRYARAWTAWKEAMWERGCKLPTQMRDGRARCFCGAEIDIASMGRHVTAAHMIETADV
jgi:hypothetical protein